MKPLHVSMIGALMVITWLMSPCLRSAFGQEKPVVANRHQAVDEGRKALGSGWMYPWYDAEHDGLRRISTPHHSWWPEWDVNLSPPDLSWLEWGFWTLVILLLALLTYLLVRVFLARERGLTVVGAKKAVRTSEDDHARIEALPFEVEQGPTSLLEAARRAAAAGNFRQAIVYLFSHELVELDRRQLIRLTRGKTNRQYLRELARSSGVRPLLEQTMILFEEVFFGDRAISQAQFDQCWQRLPEFDRLVGEVPR